MVVFVECGVAAGGLTLYRLHRITYIQFGDLNAQAGARSPRAGKPGSTKINPGARLRFSITSTGLRLIHY
jgi:hypothetical protein